MRRIGILATIVCLWVTSTASAQILVTDFTGNLYSYNPSNGSSSSINNALVYPTGMTIGPDGMLYVSNMGTNTVDKYNPYTGSFAGNVVSSATLMAAPNVVAANTPTPQYGFQPTGIKFGSGPNPNLYISSQLNYPFAPVNTGAVYSYNMTSQALTQQVGPITQGEGLLVSGSTLYAAELNNYSGQVWKKDGSNPASVFIPNGLGGLVCPIAMAIGPDGWLYVADVMDHKIIRYDPANPNNNSIFISTGLDSPTDLVFDDGHLYVVNVGSGSLPDGFLAQFNATTGAFQSIAVPNLFYGSAVVAVPEPTSLALVGIGAFGWLWRRRRIA